MRKILSFIAGTSLALQLAPLAVLAQTSTLQERRQALQDELQEKRDALKQGIQQKRDTVKQEVQQRRDTMRQEIEQKREALRAEIEKRREAFKAEAEARREELRKKLGEKRAERIEQFFARMVEKFQNAIERMKKFADRVEARINKAAENGKDVASVREQLASARLKIVEAEKAVEDAKAQYTEAAKDTDFKVAFKKVRDIVHAAAEKMKAAHRALVDVINSMKGLGGGDGHATSTPPVSTTTTP